MPSKMFKGSCKCGAVTYEASGDPIFAGHCHCLDCQKTSGAGHVTVAAFPEAAVKIKGKLKGYKSKADSGAMVERLFCPECGSSIAGKPGSVPGVISLNLGTMDEAADIAIQMRIYDKRRRSWDAMDPALPTFPAMPPMPG